MSGMLEHARAQGHYVRDDETEGGIVTRMVIENWMGKPHRPTYNDPVRGPVRCRCLPMFPEFLGPDSIAVNWWYGGGTPPPALCRYHLAGITCEACPHCVRCRRRMSSEIGHWVCDRWTETDSDESSETS